MAKKILKRTRPQNSSPGKKKKDLRKPGGPEAPQLDPYKWKPGQSGNPKGGKKKEVRIPDILREIGRQPVSDEDKREKLVAVCEQVYLEALGGQSWAVNFIADRTEGKALMKIEQTVSGKMGISDAVAAMEADGKRGAK